MLKGIVPREYQQIIFTEVVKENSLVVLPTGLGKTVIITYITAFFLKKYPAKKILICAPTRPLINQIASTIREAIGLDGSIVVEISGGIAPGKRLAVYDDARVIIATPQTISNDLTYDRVKSSDFCLFCVDEAHRAVKNYAYVKIASLLLQEASVHIVGFTATPGSEKEGVLEVVKNLQIKRVVFRTPSDPDIEPYIAKHRPTIKWIELPKSYKQILQILSQLKINLVKKLKEQGLETSSTKYISKRIAMELHTKAILAVQQDPSMGSLLYITPNLIRVLHLEDIIETQGLPQALSTLENWQTKPKKGRTLIEFLQSEEIFEIKHIIEKNPIPHPKLKELIKIVQNHLVEPDSRIIVFSNFRSTIQYLREMFNEEQIPFGVFIGQSNSQSNKGMTQKEQIQVIQSFKDGNEFRLLLSTSVGEEGIDVGACDLVVFYDSVSSVIRSIQRTGRGRKRESKVIRLITKDTRDAGMYYAIRRKEKVIANFLRHELPQILEKQKNDMKEKKSLKIDQFFDYSSENISKKIPEIMQESAEIKTNQMNSTAAVSSTETDVITFDEDSKIIIYVDSRESVSIVPKSLKNLGATLRVANLFAGDYQVSEAVVIERKTMDDFSASLIDGRLFDQLANKLSNYRKPVIILEGNFKITRNIRIEALYGAIASIVLDFRIPVLQSENAMETAKIIVAIAKREQRRKDYKEPSLRSGPSKMELKLIQKSLLATIPGLNRLKAEELLKEFNSIREVVNAEPKELRDVKGIGKVLAERIHIVFSTDFLKKKKTNETQKEDSVTK